MASRLEDEASFWVSAHLQGQTFQMTSSPAKKCCYYGGQNFPPDEHRTPPAGTVTKTNPKFLHYEEIPENHQQHYQL